MTNFTENINISLFSLERISLIFKDKSKKKIVFFFIHNFDILVTYLTKKDKIKNKQNLKERKRSHVLLVQ